MIMKNPNNFLNPTQKKKSLNGKNFPLSKKQAAKKWKIVVRIIFKDIKTHKKYEYIKMYLKKLERKSNSFYDGFVSLIGKKTFFLLFLSDIFQFLVYFFLCTQNNMKYKKLGFMAVSFYHTQNTED